MSDIQRSIRDAILDDDLVEKIVSALYDDGHLEDWSEEKKKEIRIKIEHYAAYPSDIADDVIKAIEEEYV